MYDYDFELNPPLCIVQGEADVIKAIKPHYNRHETLLKDAEDISNYHTADWMFAYIPF